MLKKELEVAVSICAMIRSPDYTDAQIIAEMAKCDLRCKICHRIVTADRAGTN